MTANCHALSLGDMISYISPIAVDAYSDKKPGVRFTGDDQKQIYKDFLKSVQKGFYSGDSFNTELNGMLDHPTENGAKEMLFVSAFDQIEKTIQYLKKKNSTAGEDAQSHTFDLKPSVIAKQIFRDYIKEHQPVPTSTNTMGEDSFGTEPDIQQHRVKEIESISALLKKVVGSQDTKYMSPMVDYLTHAVASTWVDGKVRPDGTVRGYTNLKDIARQVKSQLQERVYNYYATKANSIFTQYNDGNATRYIVYSSDRQPIGFQSGPKIENTDVQVGSHEALKKISMPNGTTEDIRMIIAPDMNSAIKAAMLVHPDSAISGETQIDSPETDHVSISITNPDQLSEVDRSAFYAHTLTTASNFELFLKGHFPQLDPNFRNSFRKGYEEPGTTSGDDQDSAAIKMHKLGTPRLHSAPDGTLTVDKVHPYLSTEDFSMASTELSRLDGDYPTMKSALETLMTSNLSGHKVDVLTSIYHRFFNPKDYEISGYIDPATNQVVDKQSMRSYAGIIDSSKHGEMTLQDYYDLEDRSNIPLSSNALLEHSLSSMIGSFRSLTVSEKMGERNYIIQKTNIANHGLTVDNFYSNFMTATLNDGLVQRTTQPKIFNRDKVSVTDVTNGATNRRIRIIIKPNKETGNELIYYADVNIGDDKSAPQDQLVKPKVFQDGIPLTITGREWHSKSGAIDPTLEEVASTFSMFGFPQNITKPSYLATLYDSIENSNIQNSRNKTPITNSVDGRTIDPTVDNLYLNMLFTSLMNGDKSNSVIKSFYDSVGRVPAPAKEGNVAYPPDNVMFGYKDIISDTITRTEGELGRKFTRGYDGNILSTYSSMSHMKLLAKLAGNVGPDSIHYGNLLTGSNPEYKVGPETYVKMGMMIGDDHKTVQEMTEKENSKFLMETAYLQSIVRSTSHNTCNIQIGVQSDRLHPQITEFTSTGPINSLFLREVNGGWNNAGWIEDAKALQKIDPSISNTEVASVKNHSNLKVLLENHNIPLSKIISDTPTLNQYGRMTEDEYGRAQVPTEHISNGNGLDNYTLAQKALFVHQNYFSGMERVALREWNKALSEMRPDEDHGHKSLQEVASYLNQNKVKYSDIKAESELQDMSMITKKKVTENLMDEVLGTENKITTEYARVPEDLLQSIAIFSNKTLGLEYISTMKNMFRKQLETSGYDSISTKALSDIKKVMSNDLLSMDSAKNALFDSYFYNSIILGSSALNIHTGGISQYDLKEKSAPLLSTKDSFENGRINTKSVLDQAKKLKVPGSNKTLGKISAEEILQLRDASKSPGTLKDQEPLIERLSYMKAILENNNAFSTPYLKAKAMLFNDLTRHTNDKFVSQVKRNQVLGSALQLPRIVGDNEPGFFLGKSSKNVAIVDNELPVKVLGTTGDKKVTITDGVQHIHPLYGIRINNSIGNEESSFKYDGVAMKDLTVANDANGSMRGQKKASNGSFSHDLYRKGSPILSSILERANTAIEFTSKNILVDTGTKLDDQSWNPVTQAAWLNHGLSFGWMKYTPADGSADKMIHATEVLRNLNQGDVDTRDAFGKDLDAGRYKTAKIERQFNNMQELWEHFGATTKEDSWNRVADIIGNHSGIGTTKLNLSDATYPLRDAYIEKIGFTSQEKTGAKNVITWENLMDPTYEFNRRDEAGIDHKRWAEVENNHHGLILQASHGFDTTSSHEGLFSTETHDNIVSIITQIISANIAEGASAEESQNISETLNALTQGALAGIRGKIINSIITSSPELSGSRVLLEEKLKRPVSPNQGDWIDKKVFDACSEHVRNLVIRSLAKQDGGGGLAAELLSANNMDKLTFDQKQILPYTQSQIFSDFNKKTVRMKVAGGQFVVSPSYLTPTYNLDINGGHALSGLTREDINTMGYGEGYAKLNKDQKSLIDQALPLEKIKNLSDMTLSDMLVDPEGTPRTYMSIKNELRGRYDELMDKSRETGTAVMPFKQYLSEALLAGDYKYRLGSLTPDKEERLQWTKYIRYDNNGNSYNALDSSEFRAYNSIDAIGKAYLKDTSAFKETFEKIFGIDFSRPEKAEPEKIHPRTFVKTGGGNTISDEIKQKVPISLLKEAYFGSRGIPSDMIAPEEMNKFNKFVGGRDIMKTLEETYKYIGKQALENPDFINKFKSDLYNLLSDNSKGWTSKPSEVYMPHMHAKAFFLHTGEDGTKSDSLFDITGLNEIPTTDRLESQGIFTHDDAIALSRDYQTAINNIKTSDRYAQLTPSQRDDIKQWYTDPMEAYRKHAGKVFKERIGNFYGTKAPQIKTDATGPMLFVFSDNSPKTMIREAIAKRNQSIVNGTHYNAMTDLINGLQAADMLKTNRSANMVLNDVRTNLINKKTLTLVNNFPKTLDFVMARIPAQGKQSYTASRIKNFIFSSKNSVYVPPELVLLAGLDYDIDKQNMMTWAVDKDGGIVPWEDYMVNGKLSTEKLQTKINSDEKTVRSNYGRDIMSLQEKHADLERSLSTLPANGEQVTDVKNKLSSLSATIDKLTDRMEQAVQDTETTNRTRFQQAGQNFIVHNLIETISSPKNAIEANTPIGTDKVTAHVDKPNISNLFTDKVGLDQLLIQQQITSPINPYSTMQYEKITMDGKSGISITAADLKAYLAAYYATRTATPDEQEHTVLKSDITTLPDNLGKQFGVNKDALQFFKMGIPTNGKSWSKSESYTENESVRNGKYVYTAVKDVPEGIPTSDKEYWKIAMSTSTMKYLANATKWSTEGKAIGIRAKEGISQLRAADPNDTKAQIDIITKYMPDVKEFNSMNVNSQAWEDLSQLLTAATDNAKEMILGKIGINNTTNSLVSTMVRLGVKLPDALDLINSEPIKDIVKRVETSTDLKGRDEESKSAAKVGILTGNKYGLRLMSELSKAKPELNGTSDEAVASYLTDPIRTLNTYAKAGFEFSILSRLLSTNQGLPNAAEDVFNYVDGLNNEVNAWITDHNKTNPGDQIEYKFDLQKFVDDASSHNIPEINKILTAMNKVRTGINVPFVLLKNSHYFSYFEAMFQAKAIRDNISYINAQTESLIMAARQKYGQRTITPQIYKGVADTIYDFGVLKYLKNVAGPESNFELQGVKYDLSEPQAKNGIQGRYELIKNLPEIMRNLPDNELATQLKLSRSVQDSMTGSVIQILKGPDLALISSEDFAKLQVGLENIKQSDPDLYKALFYYSLITTKGSYGGGSFVGLYNINEYLKFSEFIKNNAGDLYNKVLSNADLLTLTNPLLLSQVSTIPRPAGKSDVNVNPDFEIENEPDVDVLNDIENYSSLGGDYQTYSLNLNKQRFVTDDLNTKRRLRDIPGKTNSGLRPDITEKENLDYVRSKDNDLVYKWNYPLEIYVQQTRDVPRIALPFRIPENEAEPKSRTAGYVDGIRANMPFGTRVKGPDGKYITDFEKGTIISYVTNSMKGDANPESKTEPTARTLAVLLRSDPRVYDGKSEVYIVKPENSSYKIVSKDDLLRANPGFTLDDNRIIPGAQSSNISNVALTRRLYVNGSDYYSTQVEGSQPIDATLNAIASGNDKTIYDADSWSKMIESVDKGKLDRNYTLDKVNTEFNKMVKATEANLIVNRMNIPLEEAYYMLDHIADYGNVKQGIVDSIQASVDNTIGYKPSEIRKLSLLSSGVDGVTELLKSSDPSIKGPSGLVDVDFPRNNSIPIAALDLMTSGDSQNTISQSPISEFRNLLDILGIPKQLFDDYVRLKFIPETGVDALIMNNRDVYIAKNAKISLTKQVSSINDKIEKGKPVYVPAAEKYQYLKPASDKTFFAIARTLNQYLPGTNWSVLTESEIEARYGKDISKNAAFFKKNGEVVINSSKATLETPFHEYGHVYLEHLAIQDPGEYTRIMKLSADNPLFPEMTKLYPEFSKADIAEETFCELLGRSAKDQLLLNKDQNTQDVLNSMSNTNDRFGKVTDTLKGWIAKSIDTKEPFDMNINDSLVKVIDQLSDDILFGKGSLMNQFSDETKAQIQKSRTGSTLTVDEQRQLLKDRGMIEHFCL